MRFFLLFPQNDFNWVRGYTLQNGSQIQENEINSKGLFVWLSIEAKALSFFCFWAQVIQA